MKYIRTEILGVIMFSRIRKHDEMAKRVMSPNDKIISAGFVRYEPGLGEGITVFGTSSSLGVGVAEGDQDLIRMLLDQ